MTNTIAIQSVIIDGKRFVPEDTKPVVSKQDAIEYLESLDAYEFINIVKDVAYEKLDNVSYIDIDDMIDRTANRDYRIAKVLLMIHSATELL